MTLLPSRSSPGWKPCPGLSGDILAALGIALGTILVLLCTAEQGFVRDEGYYFRAASEYHRWFEILWRHLSAGEVSAAFSDEVLQKAFGYNTEHPGFIKILMGFTWKIFHLNLEWVSNANGFRLGPIILVGVGCSFAYLLGVHLFSRTTGVVGVILLLLCPHVFFHSHLACFDGPIMGLGVAVTYAFLRGVEQRRWMWGCALLWGVAIASKHNAVFLVPTLGLAFMLSQWRPGLVRSGENRAKKIMSGKGFSLPDVPLVFFAMLFLGPLIFYLSYPYGWHAPLERIGSYYNYHLHHEHYPVDYFGRLYTAPPFPWSFPFVMSALTVPLPVLMLGCFAFFRCARCCWRHLCKGGCPKQQCSASASEQGDQDSANFEHMPPLKGWTFLLSILIPPLIIAVPSVPIFGGTKHWMTMMPFFCLGAAEVLREAGLGLRNYLQESQRWRILARFSSFVLVALVVLLVGSETVRVYPWGHTYFNELALGHQGGATLGMPRTFWGGDGRQLLPLLNEEARRGARVFTDRLNYDSFRAYQKDTLLRTDLRYERDLNKADWALINHQREYRENELKVWFRAGHRRPVAVVALDGVPIVSLYRIGPW